MVLKREHARKVLTQHCSDANCVIRVYFIDYSKALDKIRHDKFQTSYVEHT